MPKATRPDADLDDAPLAVKMMYPGEWWDTDSREEEEQFKEELADALNGADIVGVVDSDADGLGTEVVIEEAFPDANVVVFSAGHREPLTVGEAGEFLAEHASTEVKVIIADLCPSEGEHDEFISPYEAFDDVTVCDHHDWSAEARDRVEEVATLVVEPEKCATQVVLDEVYPDAPDHLREFADVTADHDLWIKEDERSDDLSDFAFWAERDQYVDACREHGANIMDDPETREFVEAQRAEKEAKIRLAVEGPSDAEETEVREAFWTAIHQFGTDDERVEVSPETAHDLVDAMMADDDIDADEFGISDDLAEFCNALAYNRGADWYQIVFDEQTFDVTYEWYVQNLGDPDEGDIILPDDADDPADVADEDKRVAVTVEGPITVAAMYGSMYASGAGQAAQDAGADLAVISPPWDKVSLRSVDEKPIAATIAKELGGGGHPPAAGAGKFGVLDGEDDYYTHWRTGGKVMKARTIMTLQDLVDGDIIHLDEPPVDADDGEAVAAADA